MTNRSPIKVTREIAEKVLATIDAGLSLGIGNPTPGEMCIEAAVCFALGLPHGDDPGCVTQALRSLKIRLNDASWSSPHARAKGLRRLGLAQLGSKGVLDENDFVARLVRLVITKQVPAALRVLAPRHDDPTHQAALNAAAEKCENDADLISCIKARYAAQAAGCENAAYAAIHAYKAADVAAHADAESFAYDAASAALYAVRAISDDIYEYDKLLGEFAENVVKILVEMKAPGCEWLDLTNAA